MISFCALSIILSLIAATSAVQSDRQFDVGTTRVEFVGRSGQLRFCKLDAGATPSSCSGRYVQLKMDRLREVDGTGKETKNKVSAFASQDFTWSEPEEIDVPGPVRENEPSASPSYAVTVPTGMPFSLDEGNGMSMDFDGFSMDFNGMSMDLPYLGFSMSFGSSQEPSSSPSNSLDMPSSSPTENTVRGTRVSFSSTVKVGGNGPNSETANFTMTTITYHEDGTAQNGNETIFVPKDGLKFSIEVSDWPFLSADNFLQFGVDLRVQKGDGTDATLQSGSGTPNGPRNQRFDLGDGLSLDAPSTAVIDGMQADIVSTMDVSSNRQSLDWTFPAFESTLYYDPFIGATPVSSNGVPTESPSLVPAQPSQGPTISRETTEAPSLASSLTTTPPQSSDPPTPTQSLDSPSLSPTISQEPSDVPSLNQSLTSTPPQGSDSPSLSPSMSTRPSKKTSVAPSIAPEPSSPTDSPSPKPSSLADAPNPKPSSPTDSPSPEPSSWPTDSSSLDNDSASSNHTPCISAALLAMLAILTV